jgi:hypothetical protein
MADGISSAFKGLNTICSRRTLHTVVFNIDSSLVAVPVEFFGLSRKLA